MKKVTLLAGLASLVALSTQAIAVEHQARDTNFDYWDTKDRSATSTMSTPEPGTLALLGLGLTGLGLTGLGRKRKK